MATRIIRRRLPCGLHNMTEGRVTTKDARCALFGGCEIDRDKIRSGFPARYEHFFPKRVPGVSLSWDPERFVVVKQGAIRYHDSGQAEGWDRIRTPARGVAYIRGHHPDMESGILTFWVTWLLNSWDPQGADDQWTDKREEIVTKLELPVLREFITDEHEHGRLTTGGGDMNSKPRPIPMPGCETIKGEGLDRAYMTDEAQAFEIAQAAGRSFPGIRLRGRVTEGPVTGVGPQLKHRSVHWTTELRGKAS